MKRVEPPKGYVLDKQVVQQIMAVEAALLRSEGIAEEFVDQPDSKACRSCGEVKLLEDFYRCKTVRDGRQARCKGCQSAAYREYYAANIDHLQAEGRKNRRRWTAENPEKQRARNALSQKTPAAREAQKRKKAARKAAGVPWGGAVWERDRLLALERDDGICGLCGEDVDPFDYTLDHITPISAGGLHDPDNVQVAHRSCNSAKYTVDTA
jgi:5-methylcytosine-specific restriction endonuclease McrA